MDSLESESGLNVAAQIAAAMVWSPITNVGSRTTKLTDLPVGMTTFDDSETQRASSHTIMSGTYIGGIHRKPISTKQIKQFACKKTDLTDLDTILVLSADHLDKVESLVTKMDMDMLRNGIAWYDVNNKIVLYEKPKRMITTGSIKEEEIIGPNKSAVSCTQSGDTSLLLDAVKLLNVKQPAPSGSRSTDDKVVDAPMVGTYHKCDVMPVKCAQTAICQTGSYRSPPTTTLYKNIAERLSDINLSSDTPQVVRTPFSINSSPLPALAEYMKYSKYVEFRDVAPMVRAAVLNQILNQDVIKMDPMPKQLIRRPTDNHAPGDYGEVEIIEYPWTRPSGKLLIVTMDTAVRMAQSHCSPDTSTIFHPNGMDKEWCFVPYYGDMFGVETVIPYIAMFLHSKYWSGRISWQWSQMYCDDAFQQVSRLTHTLFPQGNCYIPGPENAVLVMVDYSSTEDTTQVGSRRLAVWNGNPPYTPATYEHDFWQIWNEWFVQANLNNIRSNIVKAWNEMCRKLGTDTTCAMALSIAADICYGNSPSMFTMYSPSTDCVHDILIGSYTDKGGRLNNKERWTSSDFFQGATLTDDTTVRQRMVSYNMAKISPFILHPTGIVRMEYQVTTHPDTGEFISGMPRWSTSVPEYSFTRYRLPCSGSLMRLCCAAGLIDTDQESYVFRSHDSMSSSVHMHGLALFGSFSVALASMGCSPRIWLGWCTKQLGAIISNIFTLYRWVEKLKLGVVTQLPNQESTLFYTEDNRSFKAIAIPQDANISMPAYFETIDLTKYLPIIWITGPGQIQPHQQRHHHPTTPELTLSSTPEKL
ncbi:hypothetical protein PV326_012767 [Microctonus aethiopoides]|nr:hypothetical protein PV326_012767 [Microctonus aethiopoides]